MEIPQSAHLDFPRGYVTNYAKCKTKNQPSLTYDAFNEGVIILQKVVLHNKNTLAKIR